MTDYVSPAKPRFFAHRGFSFSPTGAPLDENTTEAFAAAISAGARYLETDIQASSDGVAFAFHDGVLGRVLGHHSPSAEAFVGKNLAATRIEELSAAEIGQIRLEHGGSIPTLESLLTLFPNAYFNLDVKSPAAIAPTAEVINRLGCFDRVLVSSFDGGRRRRTLALLRERVATSADRDLVLLVVVLRSVGLGRLLERALRGIDALQIPAKFGFIRFDSKQFIAAVHKAGAEVHFWTINEPQEMQRLLALGADGIVTDRIDRALALGR